jgi:DNA repair exonuclease SbcCD ATPase subunit
MAARPADRNASTPGGSVSVDISDLPPLREPARPRVVSVSPDDAERAEPSPRPDAARPAGQDAFLTPRVLDQRAFDELAGMLRSLIDEAQRAAERLEAAQGPGGEPALASARLQERLRLGARMLKAFQSQIDRGEAAVGTLDEHRQQAEAVQAEVNRRLEELQAHAVEAAARFQQQLDNAVEEAVRGAEARLAEGRDRLVDLEEIERTITERTHEALQQIESHLVQRQATFEAVGQRLDQLRRRADALAGALEEAELKAAAVTESAGESAENNRAQSEEASWIARQCEEAKAALDEALSGAEGQMRELSGRGDNLVASIRQQIGQAEEAERRIGEHTEAATAAAEKLAPAMELAAELEQLLERLEPWSALLLKTERRADGMPRPVASMIEGLRTGIGQDMARISATMRELAQRVDDIGLPATPAPEPAGERAEDEEGEEAGSLPMPQVITAAEAECGEGS